MRFGRVIVAGMAIGLVGCSVAISPPTPTSGKSARPSSAAPSPNAATPTATAAATTLPPPLPTDALDLGSLGWQTVVPEVDLTTTEPIGYWLAVGPLNTETPAWFEAMTLSPWAFDPETALHPVVDGPAGGHVVYVADDGTTSEIRALDIRGADLGTIGTTPHVVYTARLSLDGRSAYAVLLDRLTGQDLGVFRVALPGDGSVEQVMEPPAVDRAGQVRLVAVERFIRTVRVSADGSEVARLACGEPVGDCVLDVLTVTDGTVQAHEPPGQSGDLVAIGDGVALGGSTCIGDGSRCVTTGIELASGAQREYPGEPPAVNEDGRLVLLQFPSSAIETHAFSVVDLDGSDARVVFATDGTVRPLYQEGVDFLGVRVELPPGWVPIGHDRLDASGGYEHFVAAVRLRDGGWVRLAVPTIYPIGGGTD